MPAVAASGPSPRVRGSLGGEHGIPRDVRSIPACAGKPAQGVETRQHPRVHPRVCGEAPSESSWKPPFCGPSPRVRGSLEQESQVQLAVRSIPACAGKPEADHARGDHLWVHPRVCGEACRGVGDTAEEAGPSPRVRGSLSPPSRINSVIGSIPACAGKPTLRARPPARPWVHPRVCGEAVSSAGSGSRGGGPSPRVRGSLVTEAGHRPGAGSIPACAGKPGVLTD